jgi:Ca2+-binding EF-hand superfamily protein
VLVMGIPLDVTWLSQTGKITFRTLKRIVTELKEDIPDSELQVSVRSADRGSGDCGFVTWSRCGRRQDMIAEADRDGDGAVTADDFYRVMRKRPGNALDDIDSDDD